MSNRPQGREVSCGCDHRLFWEAMYAEREFICRTRNLGRYLRLLPVKRWGFCQRHDGMLREAARKAAAIEKRGSVQG